MPFAMPMPSGRELPSISVSELDLPELKTWEVNGKYFIIAKVEMVEKHNHRDFLADGAPESQKKALGGRFKLLNIAAIGNEAIDLRSLEQAEIQTMKGRVLSGEFLNK